MTITRRGTLRLGAAAAAVAGLAPMLAARAREAAEGGESFDTANGRLTVHPVSHASFVMTTPGPVIYNDPVGELSAYEAFPRADLILITHQHGDHYDAETLAALMGEETELVVNPAVRDMLPEDLKSRATVLANGDSAEVAGISIEAVPAYNTTEDRLQYHPQGRDNGYVLTIDGTRVYIAGDTEDTAEMRAMENIDLAFVPMNLPYTMTVDQAASAVREFKPTHVYPYHYRGSDVQVFADQVGDASDVILTDAWYAGA